MRIAAFQMAARAGDVPANLALIGKAAAEAKAAGADVIVAPELATTGYGAGDLICDLAETVGGGQVSALAAAAARHQIAIVSGFAERAGEAIFNAAVLVDPAGRRVVYRKCQLYGAYEKALFTPGDAAPTPTQLGGITVGLLICYDVEFPELARRLATSGAEIVLVPTALPESGQAAFIAEKIVPVRAFENQIAIAYANHTGQDGRFTYAGRSCIAMPDGAEGARAGVSGAGVIFADYNRQDYSQSRLTNPYREDRQVDLL